MKARLTFRNFIHEFSPDCQEVSLRLTQQPLDKMSRRRRFFTRLHLVICAPCRAYQRQMILLDELFRAYPQQLADVSAQKLSDSARDRIRQMLEQSG